MKLENFYIVPYQTQEIYHKPTYYVSCNVNSLFNLRCDHKYDYSASRLFEGFVRKGARSINSKSNLKIKDYNEAQICCWDERSPENETAQSIRNTLTLKSLISKSGAERELIEIII